jgi:hypothetical protein
MLVSSIKWLALEFRSFGAVLIEIKTTIESTFLAGTHKKTIC